MCPKTDAVLNLPGAIMMEGIAVILSSILHQAVEILIALQFFISIKL